MIMDRDVLMLATVLREPGQQVWQSNIAHSLKQSVDAVAAFSSAWLAEDGEMTFSVRCG